MKIGGITAFGEVPTLGSCNVRDFDGVCSGLVDLLLVKMDYIVFQTSQRSNLENFRTFTEIFTTA